MTKLAKFVCLLFNYTSALFRLLLLRTVNIYNGEFTTTIQNKKSKAVGGMTRFSRYYSPFIPKFGELGVTECKPKSLLPAYLATLNIKCGCVVVCIVTITTGA